MIEKFQEIRSQAAARSRVTAYFMNMMLQNSQSFKFAIILKTKDGVKRQIFEVIRGNFDRWHGI